MHKTALAACATEAPTPLPEPVAEAETPLPEPIEEPAGPAPLAPVPSPPEQRPEAPWGGMSQALTPEGDLRPGTAAMSKVPPGGEGHTTRGAPLPLFASGSLANTP